MSRPINADLPRTEPATRRATAPPGPPRRRRRPLPAALKAIGGLFLLAVVFLAAAILGGGSGGGEEATEAPAPVGEAPSAPAETPAGQTPEQLGYPAFATANTTRIGGSDPASNAAGAALAAFPSTAPAQRPDAVVVVDAADWRGAISAAVLIATPVGAPILISTTEEMPEASSQALAALAPRGSGRTRGAQAFVVGDAAVPGGLEATAVPAGVAGGAALARLRNRLHGGPPERFLIAPSGHPAFAMPAAAWAARSGDPVLFAGRNRVPTATAAMLRRHPRVPVFVLGPSSAISSETVRRIGRISSAVRRVSGEDPVANAIALARYGDGGFGWNVNDPGHGFVVARSARPLDAAAAAPLSASGTWGPLLLTDGPVNLPDAVRGYLLDVKPGYTTDPTRAFYNHVWVIGDQEAIDVNQQGEIDELAALAKIGDER